MRLTIDTIEQREHATLVMGRTSVGTIGGIWKGAEPPVTGSYYQVELRVEGPCEVSDSWETQGAPQVRVCGGLVIFTGICEDADEDVYYLRFDPGWLEMLETSCIVARKRAGDSVSFSASIYAIGIYPYTC